MDPDPEALEHLDAAELRAEEVRGTGSGGVVPGAATGTDTRWSGTSSPRKSRAASAKVPVMAACPLAYSLYGGVAR